MKKVIPEFQSNEICERSSKCFWFGILFFASKKISIVLLFPLLQNHEINAKVKTHPIPISQSIVKLEGLVGP